MNLFLTILSLAISSSAYPIYHFGFYGGDASTQNACGGMRRKCFSLDIAKYPTCYPFSATEAYSGFQSTATSLTYDLHPRSGGTCSGGTGSGRKGGELGKCNFFGYGGSYWLKLECVQTDASSKCPAGFQPCTSCNTCGSVAAATTYQATPSFAKLPELPASASAPSLDEANAACKAVFASATCTGVYDAQRTAVAFALGFNSLSELQIAKGGGLDITALAATLGVNTADVKNAALADYLANDKYLTEAEANQLAAIFLGGSANAGSNGSNEYGSNELGSNEATSVFGGAFAGKSGKYGKKSGKKSGRGSKKGSKFSGANGGFGRSKSVSSEVRGSKFGQMAGKKASRSKFGQATGNKASRSKFGQATGNTASRSKFGQAGSSKFNGQASKTGGRLSKMFGQQQRFSDYNFPVQQQPAQSFRGFRG